MAIIVAALDNDRHSFAKEASRRQADQNVFNVLMHHNRCSLPQAMDDAIALRDHILCRFLTLRDQVLPRASQELRRYLTDLGHGIRGNAEWGMRVPRYLSLQDAASGPGEITPPTHLTWADRPLNNGSPPLPPTIAWWWQRDLAG